MADVVDAAANLAELSKRFDETQRRVDIVGLTNAISLDLRQERRRIVDVRFVLRAAGRVQSELTENAVPGMHCRTLLHATCRIRAA